MQRSVLIVLLTLALTASCFGDAKDKKLDIYWVDVEGGAATLIVTPAGESLLVDAGWPGARDSTRIANAANAAGLKQIDHFITSHWHLDHFGGLGDLVKLLPVKNFYDHSFPDLPKPDINPQLVETYKQLSGGKSIVLKAGDEIKLKQTPGSPPLALKVYAAHGIVLGEKSGAPEIRECARHKAKAADTSDNARSIAFVMSFGDWQFFDAGDLTWNVEHKLVCPQNLIGTVDVYQVTHHGSDQSNNPAVLQALLPRVAVMNNGARKGGAAATVETLKATQSLEAFFAVHRNVQTGRTDNAIPKLTANDDESCKGEPVKLSVAADAKSYSVSVPGKGSTMTLVTK